MTQIKADTAAIQAAASKFSSQATQLGELISAVTGDINALSGLWEGQGYQQFINLTTEWNKDIQSIQQVLVEVSQRVDKAGIGFSDLDQSVAASFR
ncbi:MAG TPA: WXG100 family type VII secretion target [Ktedonobacteraceae bacterium]|nr:WXG100 family type VII secretion target [Ktedonobacteraceae bacterium]